jgi:uncharacterized delta-60 repeat protein
MFRYLVFPIYFCIAMLLAVNLVAAQSGTLDTTFGNGGFVVTSVNFNLTSNWANNVVVQPDDKIVVAAVVFDGANPSMARNFYVIRYDPNGTLDQTFGNGGISTFAFTATLDREDAYGLALQPDGKILVGGSISDATSAAGVARLNSDGSLDTTFGSGGKVMFVYASKENGQVFKIKVQADGKIVLGGTSNGKFGFARLNANGSFDTSFNGGKFTVNVSAQKNSNDGGFEDIAIQPDGKYVACGLSGSGPRQPRSWLLMRLNTNGSLDSSFGSGGKTINNLGGVWSVARNVRILPNGKILVGGDVNATPTSTWTYMRYLSNGQPDTTFATAGKFQMDSGGKSRVLGLAVQADGKIVGSGRWNDVNFSNDNVFIMRLSPNGSLDASFGNGGYTVTDYNGLWDWGQNMAVQSDGKFVIAGGINGMSTTSIGLFRYLP